MMVRLTGLAQGLLCAAGGSGGSPLSGPFMELSGPINRSIFDVVPNENLLLQGGSMEVLVGRRKRHRISGIRVRSGASLSELQDGVGYPVPHINGPTGTEHGGRTRSPWCRVRALPPGAASNHCSDLPFLSSFIWPRVGVQPLGWRHA